MEFNDWANVCILVGFCFILVAVVFFLLDILDKKLYRKAYKDLDVSLKNALLTYFREKDYDQCVFEIEIVFKKIINRNKFLNIRYTNVIDLLEDHIHKINDTTIKLEEIDKDLYKREVKGFIENYAKINPLEQIKGADFVILDELIKCLDKSDVEEGRKIVNQIAIEIKNLRDTNAENEKNNRRQEIIGKVGIILSIVFGVMTFIQFFI